jgi:hypothetical protein
VVDRGGDRPLARACGAGAVRDAAIWLNNLLQQVCRDYTGLATMDNVTINSYYPTNKFTHYYSALKHIKSSCSDKFARNVYVVRSCVVSRLQRR